MFFSPSSSRKKLNTFKVNGILFFSDTLSELPHQGGTPNEPI